MRRHSTALAEDVFWKLLMRYGIHEKITSIIQNSYEWLACSAVHNSQLTDVFPVWTGVKQGCRLSPFPPCDWLDYETINVPPKIEYDGDPSDNWTIWILLMIWFSYPKANSRRRKIIILWRNTQHVWVNIHRGKSKILRWNSTSTVSVTLGAEAMNVVDHFTYLGTR